MDTPIKRQHTVLKEFDPEKMGGVIRDTHFETYMLAKSERSPSHQSWGTESFSVDTAYYSFPARGMGTLPRLQLGTHDYVGRPPSCT